MKTDNSFVSRANAGFTPAMTTRNDESFLDFVADARNILMYAQYPAIAQKSSKAMADHGLKLEHSKEGVAAVRKMVKDLPAAGIWLRIMRSSQEAFWNRVVESYGMREEELLAKLDEADKSGPGSVSWDPDFEMPDYAKVEIHMQPGGYVREELAGFHFDYGTRVFYGGPGDNDFLHHVLAERSSLPEDGKADRIMEIACSAGQLACELKKRLPDSEVWATDIAAPMVRYGHLRAMDQNLDVHFAQMPAENLAVEDNHLDLVVSHLLFHEIPVPIIERVLADVFRAIRPGGTFMIWDFPSAGDGELDYQGFLGVMDASDNCEPYAGGFVACNFETLIENAGFKLRYTNPEDIVKYGRVCDKPA